MSEITNIETASTEAVTEQTTLFYDSYDDDTKAYIQNKGFDDPKKILDSYRNLEKFVGVPEDQVFRVPKTDEDLQDMYNKLGRPSDIAEYGVENDELGASKWFYQAGLNKMQAQQLMENYTKAVQEYQAAQEEAFSVQSRNEMEELQKEWGNKYNENLEKAKIASLQFDIDSEMIDKMERAIGTKNVVSLLSKIGTGLGEAKFVDGAGVSNTSTKEGALREIERLQKDKEWSAGYISGDKDKIATFTNLHAIAYGD